jgi:hypothetical protein
MSRIWKERCDPSKHRDFMTGYQDAGGIPVETAHDNLIEKWVFFVRAASFTFQFESVAQIEGAKDYFSKKVHPARRQPNDGLEHYWQRWFERLPPGLQSEAKRKKILKALKQAIDEFTTA